MFTTGSGTSQHVALLALFASKLQIYGKITGKRTKEQFDNRRLAQLQEKVAHKDDLICSLGPLSAGHRGIDISQ